MCLPSIVNEFLSYFLVVLCKVYTYGASFILMEPRFPALHEFNQIYNFEFGQHTIVSPFAAELEIPVNKPDLSAKIVSEIMITPQFCC